MLSLDQQRILALDIRPRSFAFVVFEGPEELLLDWGARSFRQGVNAALVPLGPKVAKLLDEYLPELVLLEQPGTRTLEQIVEIQKQAEIHKVPVRLLSPRAVHEAFAGRNDNKDQIASVIAERFPELHSRIASQAQAMAKRRLPDDHIRCSCQGDRILRTSRAVRIGNSPGD